MTNHRFGRDSAWDTLDKMKRDLRRMESVDGTSARDEIIDAAQDVAIGGWAIVDRLVDAVPAVTKEKLKTKYQELGICQKMANEGKHPNVRIAKSDISIEATVSASVTASAVDAVNFREAWSIVIQRGDGTVEHQESEMGTCTRTQSKPAVELVETHATYRAKIVMADGRREPALDLLRYVAGILEQLLNDHQVPKP